MRILFLNLLISTVLFFCGCDVKQEFHLVHDFPAVNEDGSVNVVIEIPAGTVEKFEVNKVTGRLEQDEVDGKPRVVDFIGYPGNYGMVPRTLLSAEEGGDGDPLDVLVLASALERGQVISARLVGVLKMLDSGEVDDKLLAVPLGKYRNSFTENVTDLGDLKERYPNVMNIIELWFTAY